jgi:hypothetical protein
MLSPMQSSHRLKFTQTSYKSSAVRPLAWAGDFIQTAPIKLSFFWEGGKSPPSHGLRSKFSKYCKTLCGVFAIRSFTA